MDETNARLMRQATMVSVGVALVLILVKFIAYIFTDSVALLSSLVDSVLDSLASLVNLVAVRHALEPADEEHRFGHGKAEPLAGLAQAAFIAGSSLFLVFESINRLVHPQMVQHTLAGILVMLFSLMVTLALVVYQRHVIKQTGSLAIQADALHYFSDVAVNLGIILALVITWYSGWLYADPLVAMLVALYIIHSSMHIYQQSMDQLMDRELSGEDRNRIERIILSLEGVRAYHDLRTRASGKDVFIQVHIELDANLSFLEAHEIADALEKELAAAFPSADIIIHQDPVA